MEAGVGILKEATNEQDENAVDMVIIVWNILLQ